MVWYSHLFKNFAQFVVIHIFRGFSIISETKKDVFFLEFLCFLYDASDIGNLIFGPLCFLNLDCTSLSDFAVRVMPRSQNEFRSVLFSAIFLNSSRIQMLTPSLKVSYNSPVNQSDPGFFLLGVFKVKS